MTSEMLTNFLPDYTKSPFRAANQQYLENYLTVPQIVRNINLFLLHDFTLAELRTIILHSITVLTQQNNQITQC